MLIEELYDKKLIQVPSFLITNTCYLTITGSQAYGTADTSQKKVSDWDIYGCCIPPKEVIFPHLVGEIAGFGTPKRKFDQFQEHHIFDQSAAAGNGREYDITVFSIVKYFNLLMENNPNCIDTLFTPNECVIHINAIGNMIRDNRKLFLHKGCWPRFKGYAYSQLNKMTTKNPEGKRKEIREEYGMDVKFAMHTVRLLYEVEQILMEGDLDLQRNREHLKSIRRGEVPEEEIRQWASAKEKDLERLYANSNLRATPDEKSIKRLLVNCLEHHYGSLQGALEIPDLYKETLYNIKKILESAGIN